MTIEVDPGVLERWEFEGIRLSSELDVAVTYGFVWSVFKELILTADSDYSDLEMQVLWGFSRIEGVSVQEFWEPVPCTDGVVVFLEISEGHDTFVLALVAALEERGWVGSIAPFYQQNDGRQAPYDETHALLYEARDDVESHVRVARTIAEWLADTFDHYEVASVPGVGCSGRELVRFSELLVRLGEVKYAFDGMVPGGDAFAAHRIGPIRFGLMTAARGELPLELSDVFGDLLGRISEDLVYGGVVEAGLTRRLILKWLPGVGVGHRPIEAGLIPVALRAQVVSDRIAESFRGLEGWEVGPAGVGTSFVRYQGGVGRDGQLRIGDSDWDQLSPFVLHRRLEDWIGSPDQ